MGLSGIRLFGFSFKKCFNFDTTDCPSSVCYKLGLGICMYVMYIFYDRSYLCAVYQRAAKLLFLTLNPHGYLIFNAQIVFCCIHCKCLQTNDRQTNV